MLEHFHRIMTNNAHVGELRGFRRQHDAADAGPMNFDAEIIPFRMRGSERGQILAVAEADLDHARRAAAEQCIEVESPGAVELHAILRPGFFERALLRFGDATRAGDE